MASTLSEYSVGTVVVKRCKCAHADNVACNCWMLLSQTDESDIESRAQTDESDIESRAQEWFNAHGKTAEISEVCSRRRCKLKFCFRDEFNIVTTWISPVTKLQFSTILVHKDEFVQHYPHGLICLIMSSFVFMNGLLLGSVTETQRPSSYTLFTSHGLQHW